MKILHTSDWHLGKIFHEISLLDDQRHFLNQIIMNLDAAQNQGDSYDALVIAGDVYDRAVPPPEAVTLLSEFLTSLNKKFPALHVFLIAGNHDSPDRLSFAAPILENSNIHIATDASKLTAPIVIGEGADKTAFYSIPFLTPGKLQREEGNVNSEIPQDSGASENKENRENLKNQENQKYQENTALRSQEELLSEACRRISAHCSANFPDAQTVVIAHSFITSASTGKSERRFIGDVDSVGGGVFSPFTYTALGHIHKFQKISEKNVFYSGAPLIFAFDDFMNETVMLSVVLKEKKVVSVEKINVEPLRKVVRLEGEFSDFYGATADKEILSEHQNNYIEFVMKGLAGIDNPIGRLRPFFPFVLSIKRAESTSNIDSNSKKAVLTGDSKIKSEDLFDGFISDMYDGKRDATSDDYKAERELFLELAKKYTWEI